MADVQDSSTMPYDSGHFEEKMTVGRYLATRLSTLAPPMNKAPNPIKALMLLNRQQWLFFLVGVDFPNRKFVADELTDPDRLSRLDLGCFRFLLRLDYRDESSQVFRETKLRDHLGYHPGADASVGRRHYFRRAF